MLARGRGVISVKDFRAMFNLPEDAEIVGFDVNNGEVEFFMISAKEVDGKFGITESFDTIRRFRLNKGVTIVTKEDESNVN